MKRFILVMAVILLAAEILQFAVLPPVRDALPRHLAGWFEWRLLMLVGLLAGMLRGELAGLVTGWAAALLFALAGDAAFLGPGLIAFGLTSHVAGSLAHVFRFNGWLPRWIVLMLLLVGGTLLWNVTRKLFWSDADLGVPWIACMLTAAIGATLYRLLAPAFRRNLMLED